LTILGTENWGSESTNTSQPSSNPPPNLPSSSIVPKDDPRQLSSQESSSSNNPRALLQSAADALALTHTSSNTNHDPPRMPMPRSGCKGRPMCWFCRRAKRGLACTKSSPGERCDTCKRRGLQCGVRTWPDGRVEPSDIIGIDSTTFTIPINGAIGPESIFNWPPDVSEQGAGDFHFEQQVQQPQFDGTWDETTFSFDNGNELVMPLVADVDPSLAVSMTNEADMQAEFELWRNPLFE